jgi:two-component system, OmpR family, response regulator
LKYNAIYGVTAKGQEELRGAATTVSRPELDLLIRLDGILTLSQVMQGMTPAGRETFDATFELLNRKGLVQIPQSDPFADTIKFHFTPMALSLADAEADACTASLKSSNYYVRIARSRATARQRNPGERLSAIVVDDEPTLAKFLSHYLNYEGFDVRIAGNRDQIVAEFRTPPVPDLVLLDVMLPDADGFDILLRLRAHPVLKDVPIIMLTAKASRESVLKGLAGGADGYLTKPVETDSLLKAVRTVVGL